MKSKVALRQRQQALLNKNVANAAPNQRYQINRRAAANRAKLLEMIKKAKVKNVPN